MLILNVNGAATVVVDQNAGSFFFSNIKIRLFIMQGGWWKRDDNISHGLAMREVEWIYGNCFPFHTAALPLPWPPSHLSDDGDIRGNHLKSVVYIIYKVEKYSNKRKKIRVRRRMRVSCGRERRLISGLGCNVNNVSSRMYIKHMHCARIILLVKHC